MKITNKLALPAPIVAAIANDLYTKGDADFSVTELLGPAQIRKLMRQHYDEIEIDVSANVWALLGQAVHAIVERSQVSSNHLHELTLLTEFEGVRIKGQADHIALDDGTLFDFKVTTVYKVMDGAVPQEWVQQTNIYRWMLQRQHGINIRQIAVIPILRDWQKRSAEMKPGYPATQVLRLDIPVWPDEQVEEFLHGRIAAHRDPNPRCSPEERWNRTESWAVYRKGQKRALRVFDSQDGAQNFVQIQPAPDIFEIVYRPGEDVRCQLYCPVAKFCPQWQAIQASRETIPDPFFAE